MPNYSLPDKAKLLFLLLVLIFMIGSYFTSNTFLLGFSETQRCDSGAALVHHGLLCHAFTVSVFRAVSSRPNERYLPEFHEDKNHPCA